MDEVFGRTQHAGTICFRRTGALTDSRLPVVTDYLIWYARDIDRMKYGPLLVDRRETPDGLAAFRYAWRADGTVRGLSELGGDPLNLPEGWRLCQSVTLTSQHFSPTRTVPFSFRGRTYRPPANRQWSVDVPEGLERVAKAKRIFVAGDNLRFAALLDDNPMTALTNVWMDTGVGSFTDENHYVVQTPPKVLERCILMTTDPGDVVPSYPPCVLMCVLKRDRLLSVAFGRLRNRNRFTTETYSGTSDRAGLPRKCTYFPIQNRPKISPSTSSGVTAPVTSPRASPARRSSSAINSGSA